MYMQASELITLSGFIGAGAKVESSIDVIFNAMPIALGFFRDLEAKPY